METKSELPEFDEGRGAFSRFDTEVRFLLSVPKSTLAKREKAYRAKVEKNPNRPGPKRKVNASASPGPAV
jgi:hypothetical protein